MLRFGDFGYSAKTSINSVSLSVKKVQIIFGYCWKCIYWSKLLLFTALLAHQ